MDLNFYQKQMWVTIKNYLGVLAQKHENPNNASFEKDITGLLIHLVAINEKQKEVLSRMRNQNPSPPADGSPGELSHPTEEPTAPLFFNRRESSNHDDDLRDGEESYEAKEFFPVLDEASSSPDDVPRDGSDKLSKEDTNSESSPFHPAEDPDCFMDDSGQLMELIEDSSSKDEGSRSPQAGDSSPDDTDGVKDLVPPEEFMHSIGLLTIRESDDVVCKRKERYRRNKNSHIFSHTMWEKQETKRKRRDWLASGSSPPQLRKKIRANSSQPSSRQPSRPPTPTEEGSSPSSGSSPIPPSSPSDTSNRNSSPLPEEICEMCKRKGARLQCDGCGVSFHFLCIDVKVEDLRQDGWLCLKCERFGLRNSSVSTKVADPSYDELRKEQLSKKETLLQRRAELNLTKQELQAKKDILTSSFKEIQEENWFLKERKLKTLNAVEHLKNFVSFFKRATLPEPDCSMSRPSLAHKTANIRLASLPSSTTIHPSTKSSLQRRSNAPKSSSSSKVIPLQISRIRSNTPSVSISPVSKSSFSPHGHRYTSVHRKHISTATKSLSGESRASSVLPSVSVEIVPRRSGQQNQLSSINHSIPGPTHPNITLSKVDIKAINGAASSRLPTEMEITGGVPNRGSPSKLCFGTDVNLS